MCSGMNQRENFENCKYIYPMCLYFDTFIAYFDTAPYIHIPRMKWNKIFHEFMYPKEPLG